MSWRYVYAARILGAGVYSRQRADTFWAYVLVVFRVLLWPAVMVYQVAEALGR